MISCDEAGGLIARRADGVDEDADARVRLDAHLESCGACHAALEDQRVVAGLLRSRPIHDVSPEFAVRLGRRLDDVSGWLGIADWRVWTWRLAPVAAALGAVAFLTLGQPASQGSTVTLDEWARSSSDLSSPAPMLWQQDVTADSLLEAMVTGRRSDNTAESGDVR